MPNRRYEAGRRYEYKVKKQLEKEGWTVLRMAGSHGLFDLVALRHLELNGMDIDPRGFLRPRKLQKNEMRLIQCKTGASAKRAIKEVERTDIKRFEGLYNVSVEVV